MIKKISYFFIIIIFILFVSCSFDDKTGIWSDEKKRIVKLEESQKRLSRDIIFSSDVLYSKEIVLEKEINLSIPRKTLSWEMYGLNQQNFLGNIYLSGIDNKFLKKKIGKNKFSLSRITNSPLIYQNYIFLSDDKGTIFNINQNGKINWKKNVYKNIYKKIYKNLTFAIYKNNIYVADNIGFIYAFVLDTGKLVWIKNHGVPLKSKIKIFDNMIFLTNQDNRILCLDIKNGSKICQKLSSNK